MSVHYAGIAASLRALAQQCDRAAAQTPPPAPVGVPDTVWSRAEVLAGIAAVMAASPDLPPMCSVRINQYGDGIALDLENGPGRPGIEVWAAALGLTPADLAWRVQPYPLDGPYDRWCTTATAAQWHGWHLSISADEPITDAHVAEWESPGGGAQQRLEYLARVAEMEGRAGE